jgi:hypothetical protein
MEKVQKIDRSYTAPSSKTFRDELTVLFESEIATAPLYLSPTASMQVFITLLVLPVCMASYAWK